MTGREIAGAMYDAYVNDDYEATDGFWKFTIGEWVFLCAPSTHALLGMCEKLRRNEEKQS